MPIRITALVVLLLPVAAGSRGAEPPAAPAVETPGMAADQAHVQTGTVAREARLSRSRIDRGPDFAAEGGARPATARGKVR